MGKINELQAAGLQVGLASAREQEGWGDRGSPPLCCHSAGVFGCLLREQHCSEMGGRGDGPHLRTDPLLEGQETRGCQPQEAHTPPCWGLPR